MKGTLKGGFKGGGVYVKKRAVRVEGLFQKQSKIVSKTEWIGKDETCRIGKGFASYDSTRIIAL